MIATGKITGFEIKENQDNPVSKLMLQVEVTDPDDIQSIQAMSRSGEDSNPPNGSTVTILNVSDSFKLIVASDDGIVPSMGQGEKKLYSVSGGAIAAFMNFLTTGVIEINGNADNAVRFSNLETAFNQLKADYNLHVHALAGGVGVASPPSPTTTADMSSAKVDEVKLP